MTNFIGTIKVIFDDVTGTVGTESNVSSLVDPSVKAIIESHAKALANELNDLQG